MKNSNPSSITPSEKLEVLISNPSDKYSEIKKRLEELNLANRVSEMWNLIVQDEGSLNVTTNKLSTDNNSIVSTKKILYLIDTLDEDATIGNIIKQNTQIVNCFKNAIKRVNERFKGILDLLNLIADLDKDIYSLVEKQGIDSNELKQILIDIFKEQGMSDEQIDNLLNVSFQRGYILRERIAKLRKDYDNLRDDLGKIQDREHKIEVGFNEVLSKTNTIESGLEEARGELAEIGKKLEILVSFSEELAQLRENITQIQTNLNEKANAEEFKELQEQFKESAQNQVKLNEKLNQKADATIVDDKLTKLWIAYGVTTAALLAGLIASFLI